MVPPRRGSVGGCAPPSPGSASLHQGLLMVSPRRGYPSPYVHYITLRSSTTIRFISPHPGLRCTHPGLLCVALRAFAALRLCMCRAPGFCRFAAPRFRFAAPGVTHGVASPRLPVAFRPLHHVTQLDNHPIYFTSPRAALRSPWAFMCRPPGFCRFAAVYVSPSGLLPLCGLACWFLPCWAFYFSVLLGGAYRSHSKFPKRASICLLTAPSLPLMQEVTNALELG